MAVPALPGALVVFCSFDLFDGRRLGHFRDHEIRHACHHGFELFVDCLFNRCFYITVAIVVAVLVKTITSIIKILTTATVVKTLIVVIKIWLGVVGKELLGASACTTCSRGEVFVRVLRTLVLVVIR